MVSGVGHLFASGTIASKLTMAKGAGRARTAEVSASPLISLRLGRRRKKELFCRTPPTNAQEVSEVAIAFMSKQRCLVLTASGLLDGQLINDQSIYFSSLLMATIPKKLISKSFGHLAIKACLTQLST